MSGSDPFDATTEGIESRRRRQRPIPTVRFVFRGAAGVVDEPVRVVTAGTTVLGRLRGEHVISLEHDSLASREHARLHWDPQAAALWLEDLGSRNGVRVNGQPSARHALADGDVVRLGASFLVVRFEDPLQRDVPIAELVGASPAMQRARMAVKRLARESASVLILGETGTGKEVVAQAIHRESGRAGRFVALNCTAIQPSLAESELFGHVAGAFTGAARDHDGYLAAAHHGTLLLDEIGDMPPPLQPKLLRALETRQITKVGSTRPIDIDVRVLAATHVNLPERAESGDFRSDLFARLAQLRVDLAPLRERREDILALLAPKLRDAPPMSPELVEALLTASWPHNVRELLAIATELTVWGRDRDLLDVDILRGRLEPASGGEAAMTSAPAAPSSERSREPSHAELEELLAQHGGNVAAVAKLVGRSRTQVYRWIDKHGIALERFRPEE